MNRDELNREILDAHANGEGEALARLYQRAGNALMEEGKVDEACFFLTQGFIYALERGMEEAGQMRAVLARHGRER